MKFASACLLLAIVVLPLIGAAQQTQTDKPNSSATNSKKTDPFREARKDVEQITVMLKGEKQTLHPKPLYAFDDNTRRWRNASSWVWGGKSGRPVALMGMSTLNGVVRYNEYASFSKHKLAVDTGFGTQWTPEPGWIPKPIPKAPKPAKTARGRLVQMRHLARQFAVKQFEPKDAKGYELRLLPAPIYRYTESKESLDGAFFAFVREQDLETVLVIDAEKQEDGTSRWVFDCKPQSGNTQKAYLKKNVVWSTTQQNRKPDSPYFIFVRRLRN